MAIEAGAVRTGPLFFALPGNAGVAERLATALSGEVGSLTLRDFPDGESYVRVDTSPESRDVVIVCTLARPNDKVLPLLFLADTVRTLGARRVGFVAPYLAYMRQDARFHPGEALTSRAFATLLSRATDWLVTVDPHLHRLATLRAVYTVPAIAVHVAAELGRWIAENVEFPLIIGPDEESRQWADGIAAAADAPSTVLAKVRRGDADVVESIPALGVHRSRTPVLVDDIISTGQTMIAALRHLRDQGAPAAQCVAVHAVFASGAHDALKAAGASRVVTTNTIAHETNAIDIVPALAGALREPLGM